MSDKINSQRELVQIQLEAQLEASGHNHDSVWQDCQLAKFLAASIGAAGTLLSVVAAVLTVLTGGLQAALPLLIVSTQLTTIGAATNILAKAIEVLLHNASPSRCLAVCDQLTSRDGLKLVWGLVRTFGLRYSARRR